MTIKLGVRQAISGFAASVILLSQINPVSALFFVPTLHLRTIYLLLEIRTRVLSFVQMMPLKAPLRDLNNFQHISSHFLRKHLERCCVISSF